MVLGRALFQPGRASFLGPASEVAGVATLAVKIFYSLRDTPPAHQGEAACMR